MNHEICDCVGVLFVGVPLLTDASAELNPGPLLDDVRGCVDIM